MVSNSHGYDVLKRGLDIAVSAIGLVVSAPVESVIWVVGGALPVRHQRSSGVV